MRSIIIFLSLSLILFFFSSCEKEQNILANETDTPIDTTSNPIDTTDNPTDTTIATITYNGINYNINTGLNADKTKLFDSRDNNIYDVIQFGNQLWMAENLRFQIADSRYNYSNPNPKYGRLYNWATAMNGEASSATNPSGVQGICPKGWHIPSDAEWIELEITLGLSVSDANSSGYRGTHGKEMKSKSGWIYNNGNGTNSSGFNVFPCGYHNRCGFKQLGRSAFFLSATNYPSGKNGWSRYLNSRDAVARYRTYKEDRISCRCLKD